MNGVSILGLIVVSVFALVCAGCNTAAKQAEGREILERYQQELDRLEKSAKELDDESQTFDEKVAATNKNDPDEHWSVMMLATGFDQVLREYKRDYELVKQKIDSEFEAAGLSQEVCDDVWSPSGPGVYRSVDGIAWLPLNAGLGTTPVVSLTVADGTLLAGTVASGVWMLQPFDIDGDGVVGITDLLMLLAAWGPCPAPCPSSCAADLDADCNVGISDFLLLLANWT